MRYTERILIPLGIVLFFGFLFYKVEFGKKNLLMKSEFIEMNNVSLCYAESEQSSVTYFTDIMDHKRQPITGKSIFFLETSCSKTGIATLNARQACAIESAAHENPDRQIFVVFVSPVGIKEGEPSPPNFDILMNYPNINFRTLNMWQFTRGTSIHEWLKTNQLFESKYVAEHMSDVFRALLLLKYGGFYADLDVIVLKSFNNLEENFIPNDWDNVVNGAVIHLNNYGIGAELVQKYMEKVIQGYDGNAFISAGPTVLTRVLEEICGTTDRSLWTRERCSGIKLEPKELIYPVTWSYYHRYLVPSFAKYVLNTIEEKKSVVIHVWNDKSKKHWFKTGTKSAHQIIAQRKCPASYRNSKYF